jgi:hypothetical protein
MSQRVEVASRSKAQVHTLVGNHAGVKVVDSKPGPVSWLDKLKSYYHTAITLLGALLIFVNEVTPALDWLPGNDKQAVTVAIGFLTALANFLKSNEQWFEEL